MILSTKVSNFNRSISVNIDDKSIELKFDNVGECKVEDKLGRVLCDKYSFIWQKGFEPEKPKTDREKITEEFVKEIQSKCDSLSKELEDKKTEIEVITRDFEEWKSNYQLVEKELEQIKFKLSEKEKESILLKKRYAIEINLWKSSVEQIKKLCEKSGYNKEDYEKLIKKEDLIEFIMKKD